MTTYSERPESQIKAASALRIGRLFCDVEKRLTGHQVAQPDDALFTTLLLHTLLTTCAELMEDMKKIGVFRHELTDIPSIWGLTKSMVVCNTFSKILTHFQVVKRIGIALCHPIAGSIDSHYPATGYLALVEKGLNTGFTFVYSPDIGNAGTQPTFVNIQNAEIYRTRILKEFERELNYKTELIRKGIPDIEVKKEGSKKYILVNDDGSPYVRIFRIEVPLKELKSMFRGVSNYLAQPTQEHWNGKDFKQLVNGQEAIEHVPGGGLSCRTSVWTVLNGGVAGPSTLSASSR